MKASVHFAIAAGLAAMASQGSAQADDLFRSAKFASLATDQRASEVGDILTVIVYQSAEARNAAQNSARQNRSLSGRLSDGSLPVTAEAALSGAYTGQGETRRSESFTTQFSVSVVDVLDNGDLVIAGDQNLYIQGERTKVKVRGRVRPADVMMNNQVLSSRIADAEIHYDGRGFVSRNAGSGLIGWILGTLGLGG